MPLQLGYMAITFWKPYSAFASMQLRMRAIDCFWCPLVEAAPAGTNPYFLRVGKSFGLSRSMPFRIEQHISITNFSPESACCDTAGWRTG